MGRGRPPKARGIASIRELTPEDIASLNAEGSGRVPAVQQLRDSHHKVARLIAAGMRLQDVAAACGYSMVRIYTLNATPAFQELIAGYRGEESEAYAKHRDDYHELLFSNQIKAERRIADKLDDDDADISIRELHLISRDAADRTGYGKNSVQFNINADFASNMEQTMRRSSQVIEGTVVAPGIEQPPSVQRLDSPPTVPSPFKRRA